MATKLKIEKKGMKFKKNLLLGNYRANVNQTLLKWFLGGPLWEIPIKIFLSETICSIRWNSHKIFMWISHKVLYVKLSSAVGAILGEVPNRRTHFWKRTIQWLFHLIEQMVSDKKIFMGISHRGPPKNHFSKVCLSKLCPSAPSCIQGGRHY
jgi:hypothetical protein